MVSSILSLYPYPKEMESISIIEMQCVEDMDIKDKMQGEMLRTLLKRLIINVTRIAKQQTESYRRFTDDRMDCIRKFNLLSKAILRTQHEVQYYAQAMNKSPKPLPISSGSVIILRPPG